MEPSEPPALRRRDQHLRTLFSGKKQGALSMNQDPVQDIHRFLESWPDSPDGAKQAFVRLKDHLASAEAVRLSFEQRQGITSSLRATQNQQTMRPLFVMVDVIEDEPRWLSVCFYADLVSDPQELGDEVPDGLLGEDAVCFDLEGYDEDQLKYLEARIDEALANLPES
jgi:hypothetical protein